MKKLLNTLYVSTPGSYLCHEGESVLVKVERETRLRVPIHMLAGIVCVGQVSCSQPLMGLCGRRDVSIAYLTENGRFLARVQGPVSGNVLLRRAHYRMADDPGKHLETAKSFVIGKVFNSRTLLQRTLRDYPDRPENGEIQALVERIPHMLREIRKAQGLDELRGFEGETALRYFSVFDAHIVAQKDEFRFTGRNRRPPTDRVNALLSYAYTLLTHDAVSALESVGLDPQVGFLHAERPGRPALALDLMEEFRPILGDKFVLSLINLKQLQAADFRVTESGAVEMADSARKTFLAAYQQRKQDEVLHPFLEERMPVGLLLYSQALLLARYIRGDLDAYPPFVWK